VAQSVTHRILTYKIEEKVQPLQFHYKGSASAMMTQSSHCDVS